jgi:hypothetical protein
LVSGGDEVLRGFFFLSEDAEDDDDGEGASSGVTFRLEEADLDAPVATFLAFFLAFLHTGDCEKKN